MAGLSAGKSTIYRRLKGWRRWKSAEKSCLAAYRPVLELFLYSGRLNWQRFGFSRVYLGIHLVGSTLSIAYIFKMRHLLRLFLLVCSIGCALPALAQDPVLVLPDSLDMASDSTTVQTKTGFLRGFFTDGYPNPRKAALLSLVVPGSGQAYNRKWWKVPIVYGTLGGLVWLQVTNVRTYREYRDNYKLLADGDPATNPTDPAYDNVDQTTLKSVRDTYRRYVDQSSLILGLAYLLTATDALVDAHLHNFDTSDDLSLRFRPRVQSSSIGPAFGIAMQVDIGKWAK